jgi:cytochrome b6-f complex iron-sulfur subunit
MARKKKPRNQGAAPRPTPSESSQGEDRQDIETSTEHQPSRRAFLWKAWIGLAALGIAETVWVALSFLRPRKPPVQESAAVVTAGPVDSFSPGSVTAFPQGKFYLARLEDGGFLAVSRECTHLGCTVPWVEEENRYVCPCHSSAFDIRGEVINPPAPRALDLLEVRIENRIVKVNTARVQRRSSFSSQQVTRP